MKKSVSKNTGSSSNSTGSNSTDSKPIDDLISSLKKIAQFDSPKNLTLNQRLHEFGVPPVIIIESDSLVRLQQAIASIELLINQDLVKKGQKALTKVRFQGESLSSESKLSELIIHLNSRDFFSTASLVILQEPGKLKEKSFDSFFNAARKCEDSLTIIVFKTLPILKIWKEIFKEFTPYSIKKMPLANLIKWIERQAKLKGLSGITAEAAEFLAKELEESVDLIDQALDKISLSSKLDALIDLEAVKKLYTAGVHKDSFSLFQSIAKKDLLLSELILDELLDTGMHPLQLTGFISKCIRVIATNKTKSASLSSDLSNQWFLRNLPSASFSESRLKDALKILAEIDQDIKGKNYGEEQLLKSRIINI